MASDSDIEAYLNQLSKKAYSLKKDSEKRHSQSSSSISSDEDKYPNDCSSLESAEHLQSQIRTRDQYRKYPPESIHDIAALSKYGEVKRGRGKSHDKFSSLEEKYLNKYISSKAVKSSKHERKVSVSLLEEGIQSKADKKITSGSILAVQKDSIQNDTSVEDLVSSLSETSLQEYQNEGSNSVSEKQRYSDENEIWDEVLNVNNIMTVDILGHVDDSDDMSVKEAKDNFRTVSGSRKPSSEYKSYNTGEEEETIPTIRSSQEPAWQEFDNEGNNNYNPPVGMLLAQTSSNLFRSSRRKSSIEFNVENLAKLFPRQKDNVEPEIVSEENASSPESHVAESVVETEITEEDPSVEEHINFENSDVKTRQELTNHAHPVSADNHEDRENASYRDSIHLDSRSLKSVSSGPSNKSSPSHKQAYDLNVYKMSKDLESSAETGTLPKDVTVSSQGSKRSKKKNKYSSSGWSSDKSWESEHLGRYHGHRSTHKHRRCNCCHWCGVPSCVHCMHWKPHCCHHAYASPGDNFTSTTALQSYVLKGNGTVLRELGVEELMKQQVALIRQFMECQQNMYQAYTATLTTNHQYTTLRSTRKYIEKQQPPLSFKEAYRLVKEEMDSSEL